MATQTFTSTGTWTCPAFVTGVRGRRADAWFKITDMTAGSVNGVTADTANSRLTVNSSYDGTYLVSGWWNHGSISSVNTTHFLKIYKDGTAVPRTQISPSYANLGTSPNWFGNTIGPITSIIPLNAGSYVELWGAIGAADSTQNTQTASLLIHKL